MSEKSCVSLGHSLSPAAFNRRLSGTAPPGVDPLIEADLFSTDGPGRRRDGIAATREARGSVSRGWCWSCCGEMSLRQRERLRIGSTTDELMEERRHQSTPSRPATGERSRITPAIGLARPSSRRCVVTLYAWIGLILRMVSLAGVNAAIEVHESAPGPRQLSSARSAMCRSLARQVRRCSSNKRRGLLEKSCARTAWTSSSNRRDTRRRSEVGARGARRFSRMRRPSRAVSPGRRQDEEPSPLRRLDNGRLTRLGRWSFLPSSDTCPSSCSYQASQNCT